MRAFRVYCQSG